MRKLFCCAVALFFALGVATAADVSKPKMSQPVITQDRPRIAYVAFRVLDADRSLKFYTGLLGMKERQRIPLESGVTEILLGYGDPNKDAGLLLLYNPNHKEPYTHGDGYHRFIIGVNDLAGLVANLKANGVKVTRDPTRVENLKLTYAFVSDPDGYAIELVQND